VIVVEALKRRRSSLLQRSSEPAHGLDSSVQSDVELFPNFSRLGIPSPPKSFGGLFKTAQLCYWLKMSKCKTALMKPYHTAKHPLINIDFWEEVPILLIIRYFSGNGI
jgi:hypothetical protein